MPTIHVKLYKPEVYQKAVHTGLDEHWPGSIHIVKAVRQCGKSLMSENILIKCSLQHSNQTSILISPTLKQSKKIFKSIVKIFKGTPLLAGSNATELEIDFINGSKILLLSAEQGDNLRGYTVTKYGILIFDEAAYIRDDVFYLCTPFVNANDAPIMAVSTPKFKTGFFYELFADGKSGKKNVYSYDFTEYPNPYLSPEKLEFYRSKMPINLFRADYLGLFMEATSDVFGDFKRILSNTVTMDGNHIAGIDWGIGKGANNDDSDSTALSIFNGHRQQIRLYHWNDLDETSTISAIVDALREYQVKKVTVETNSIGGVYLGLLKKAIVRADLRCQVVEFTTSNESKREVIEELVVEIQNRTIQLLDESEQSIQLSAYQMEKTPSGKITYNAANGYHDDIIIADALALHGFKMGNYNIR